MTETEIEKLKRLRLSKLIGTWPEILKEFKNYSTSKSSWGFSSNGFLIKFLGVKEHYTPYIFTEENIGKLYYRRRNDCFMIPGESGGTYSLSDEWNYIFQLIEIPEDTMIDMIKFRNSYNIKIADRKQYEYY